MENYEQKEATIIISDVSFSTYGPKIKDERGLIYNVSQFKKGTNQETVAYSALNKLPNFGAGLKKTFKYVEMPNRQGGTSRYVNSVFDATGQQDRPSRGEQVVRNQIITSKTQTEEEKWNAISKGKVRHGVACEYIRLGKELSPLTVKEIDRWTDYIMTGKLFAIAPENDEPKYEPDLEQEKPNVTRKVMDDIINMQEPIDENEIRVEDIPF